jgi:hypothetical protein
VQQLFAPLALPKIGPFLQGQRPSGVHALWFTWRSVNLGLHICRVAVTCIANGHSLLWPQVHRDKSGKQVSEEDLKTARDKERKDKQWETPDWGAGVAQQRNAAAAAAEMKAAAAQPFARSRSGYKIVICWHQHRICPSYAR